MTTKLTEETTLETSGMEVDESVSKSLQKLTKTEKMKQKKKAKLERKRLEKANKPVKPKPEPKLPSSVILPERRGEIGQFTDEAALLTEIKRRLCEQNAQTLRVSPIPKKCPPGLLHDLCSTAISVRLPIADNVRFGFLEFKSQMEAQAALKQLSGKQLDGKELTVTSCSDRVSVPDDHWKDPSTRTLADFDLCSLYVSRLSRAVVRTDLAQIFRNAANLKLVTLPDGSCRGSCQLRFRSQNDAVEAFKNLHETVVKGIPIHINFSIKSLNRPQKTVAPIPMKIGKADKKNFKKRPAPPASDGEVESVEVAKRARTDVETPSSKKGKKKNKTSSAGSTEFSIKQKQHGDKKQLPKLQSYQIKSNNKKKVNKTKLPRAK